MSGPASPGDVGLFGGSFDPPHMGHVLAVAYALATGGFERLIVVPTFAHAFTKELSPFGHRVRMAELAFTGMAEVRVSPIEEKLGAPSRTLRTVEELERVEPGVRLRLVIGSDILGEKDQWHAWDELVRRAPPFVLDRAGVANPGARAGMLPHVSSTEVRRQLFGAKAPRERDAELRRVVPLSVLRYVDQHGLYRQGRAG